MRQRVLVVDDDPMVRRVSRRALERAQLTVADAGSVGEAMELIESQEFDTALLDYFLEDGQCGCQLIRPLHDRNASIRIVVVSGLGGLAELNRHAYRSGADLVAGKLQADWVSLACGDETSPSLRARPEVDLWSLQRSFMHGALLVHRGCIAKTARALGINRTSLHRALRKTPLPDLDEG